MAIQTSSKKTTPLKINLEQRRFRKGERVFDRQLTLNKIDRYLGNGNYLLVAPEKILAQKDLYSAHVELPQQQAQKLETLLALTTDAQTQGIAFYLASLIKRYSRYCDRQAELFEQRIYLYANQSQKEYRQLKNWLLLSLSLNLAGILAIASLLLPQKLLCLF